MTSLYFSDKTLEIKECIDCWLYKLSDNQLTKGLLSSIQLFSGLQRRKSLDNYEKSLQEGNIAQ